MYILYETKIKRNGKKRNEAVIVYVLVFFDIGA